MINKIKDIFYDKNDILIALIIVVIAGFIITDRSLALMNYNPEQGPKSASQNTVVEVSANGQSTTSSIVSSTSIDTSSTGMGTNSATSSSIVSDNSNTTTASSLNTSQGNTATSANPPAQTSQNTQTTQNTQTQIAAGPKSIVIPSGSNASSIAKILLNAEVISSEQNFLTALKNVKADSKLKAGTFTIPSGASTTQIITILTK